MPKLLRRILKYPAWLFARLGIVGPLVFFYARVIKEVGPGHSRGDGNLPTLFALTSNRFRGDLEILARTGEFRVLRLPFAWQARLMSLFYPPGLSFEKYYQAEADDRVGRMQKNYRDFLDAFLRKLLRRLDVNCVIGAAVHYKQDYDWGLVSDRIGVPYVVLHRENLLTNTAHVDCYVNRSREMGRFPGSRIITHNEIVREALIRSGYASPEKINSLGCLRMDSYLRKLRSHKAGTRQRRRVTFFSFAPGTALFALTNAWPKDRTFGFVELFETTHAAYGELARDHPEVDFILKPKWGGQWVNEIDRVLRLNGIVPKDCANLYILPDADAQELILESDVVCGFGSTVLLEAAIARKPVIVPHYAEALRPEFSTHIHFKDHFDLFDIAGSPAEFKSLILKRLADPVVDEACMAAREAAFERFVSSLRGDATEKCTAVLKRVIENRKSAPVSQVAD